ncbi:MAG: hypothetical protein ABR559_04200 [Gemmatimonadota bacterium]
MPRPRPPCYHAELGSRPWFPKRRPISAGDITSLFTERHHYIRDGDGREELYNFQADPGEQEDL